MRNFSNLLKSLCSLKYILACFIFSFLLLLCLFWLLAAVLLVLAYTTCLHIVFICFETLLIIITLFNLALKQTHLCDTVSFWWLGKSLSALGCTHHQFVFHFRCKVVLIAFIQLNNEVRVFLIIIFLLLLVKLDSFCSDYFVEFSPLSSWFFCALIFIVNFAYPHREKYMLQLRLCISHCFTNLPYLTQSQHNYNFSTLLPEYVGYPLASYQSPILKGFLISCFGKLTFKSDC